MKIVFHHKLRLACSLETIIYMNPKGEKISFQGFDCKMLSLSHQNFKLFQ